MSYKCVGEDPKELKRIIKIVNKFTKDLINKGPEACKAFLVELGTHNPDGSITKEYGGRYTQKR